MFTEVKGAAVETATVKGMVWVRVPSVAVTVTAAAVVVAAVGAAVSVKV